MGDIPVRNPFITDALVQKIHLANEEAGQKERAFDTMFRHSDAGACARKMSYSALKYDQTNPMDLPGEWVTWLGSLIHERLQDAMRERFGSACEVEVKVRHGGLSSGHIDAVITNVPDTGTIAYELKTKGGYGFDKAVGINRKGYKVQIPQGPGAPAKIQGALNAMAVEADLLIVGVIGMESISKQLADRVGWGELARFIGEFHYPREEYLPWARDELTRMTSIRSMLDLSVLAGRMAIGDEHQTINLSPDGDRASWQCHYCSFHDRCLADGAGSPNVQEVAHA